jgi:hypothetical protein
MNQRINQSGGPTSRAAACCSTRQLARETIARLGLPVLVQWCPDSKYALFFAEVTGMADMQVSDFVSDCSRKTNGVI